MSRFSGKQVTVTVVAVRGAGAGAPVREGRLSVSGYLA